MAQSQWISCGTLLLIVSAFQLCLRTVQEDKVRNEEVASHESWRFKQLLFSQDARHERKQSIFGPPKDLEVSFQSSRGRALVLSPRPYFNKRRLPTDNIKLSHDRCSTLLLNLTTQLLQTNRLFIKSSNLTAKSHLHSQNPSIHPRSF